MSDIPPVLDDWTRDEGWLELSGMMKSGGAPQALAAVVPGEIAVDFRDLFAKRALCFSGTGEDGCDSCAGWTVDGHPDMVIAGKWGEPPGIADCLDLQWQLGLKPVAAPGRLGVISSAEGLSLPAANSLLKITEEPPAGGRILFIAGRDEFIPTIRSRVWMFRLAPRASASLSEPTAPPVKAAEWAAWFERTKKNSLEELAGEVGGWILDLCGRGEWRSAASLENAIFLAQKRHLPVSMVQDALFALLMEGIEDGKIFGDLREA
jgi:DNA polymerase-3 subunit delta'